MRHPPLPPLSASDAPRPLTRDSAYPAGRTALLLVDMQRAWLEPDHAAPPTPPPDFFQRVWQQVVPNQERLLRLARAAGIEVLHTVIRSLTADGRDRSLDHKLSGIHLSPDSALARTVAALAPLPDEIVLDKTSSGVFNSTAIDYLLRNLGVTHLVVAGVYTDQCVDMAVRDAADRGYLVTCVADACAAPTRERHEQALRAFGGYCWLADTRSVADRFERLADAATKESP